MAKNLTVTLNVLQGLSFKMVPLDLARLMLKQVQHDSILIVV